MDNSNTYPQFFDKNSEFIHKLNPKVIALPCYIFNINCVVELSKLIKKRNPQTIIVFGGPEASFEYDNLLEIADIVIVGEGEIAFNQMVCELEKADYKLENKKVYKGKSINFFDLKSPYSIDYFNGNAITFGLFSIAKA